MTDRSESVGRAHTGASRSTATTATQPLAGVRIVEISSFVAAPLAGMTLAQLGADVIRVDPIGGAADYRRWPLTDAGESIYWTGLNKGKRSVTADLRTPAGQQLVARLITAGGPTGGILLTNAAGRDWLDYDTLVARRPDLIGLEILGRADGSAAVDYTVNAGTGFPLVTGPADHEGPVNHVLPAWDLLCGVYAALAITAAVRHRDATGQGSRIRLPLEDVALATAGHLGFLTEAALCGRERPRLGNAIYGQYGQHVTGADGVSFMLVALTPRHFRDLTDLTGTTEAVAALAAALGADFTEEGTRYRHRDLLTALFTPWFRDRDADEIATALAETSILWERYRSFGELATDPRVTANPLFSLLHQPEIGEYLAPGLPMSVNGAHVPARPAPRLGEHTDSVLRASAIVATEPSAPGEGPGHREVVVPTVGLAEIAAGAADLAVDETGVPTTPLVVVDLSRDEWAHAEAAVAALRRRTVVVVGCSPAPLPDAAEPLLDALTCTLAPSGPGRSWAPGTATDLDAISRTVSARPRAALTLVSLLDITSRSDVPAGLVAESLAYSTLLAGPEFAAWRAATRFRPVPGSADPVLLDRRGDVLTVTLNRPERHNAFGRAVRDGLLAGLAVAERDESIREVLLRGNGHSFCSGGDLDEFGTAPDVSAAHLVRLQQSAGYIVHRLAPRVRAVLHGACIGAGIEVPSFAGRAEAAADAWFQLPELSMGLVPGAGGTVGITRRIGRWRTAYLVLTGRAIGVDTALAWGLIDGRV